MSLTQFSKYFSEDEEAFFTTTSFTLEAVCQGKHYFSLVLHNSTGKEIEVRAKIKNVQMGQFCYSYIFYILNSTLESGQAPTVVSLRANDLSNRISVKYCKGCPKTKVMPRKNGINSTLRSYYILCPQIQPNAYVSTYGSIHSHYDSTEL